jgi:hypothetical protein
MKKEIPGNQADTEEIRYLSESERELFEFIAKETDSTTLERMKAERIQLHKSLMSLEESFQKAKDSV